MSGNVNEWCLDWYGYYSADSIVDPIGPKDGYQRIARGGSWKSKDSDCGVTKRYHVSPYNSYGNVGLRLCLSTSFKGNYSGVAERKQEDVVVPKKSYDIPNIIWRVILSIGLAAIILVLIPTVIGAYVSIMIAKPGFEAIWNGSCDIF